jgi:hypothetical protein
MLHNNFEIIKYVIEPVYLCAEFGYVPYATGRNFVKRHGPQSRILLSAMGHEEICMRYGQQRRILLCAMGHSTEFC